MKLLILSDLHNEFSVFEPQENDVDVVILAGDIDLGTRGLNWARHTFPNQEIIYVPGNHEFYGMDRTRTLNSMRSFAKEHGIHFLDNDEVVIDGVRFLGNTLWTDFELLGMERKEHAMLYGARLLNDFKIIYEDFLRFTPQNSLDLHNQSLSWMRGKLDEPFDGKTVVVTHHLPSMKSVAERFKKDTLSACFASNLDYLFGKMDLWIHGHTHDNFDYVENRTRVICNPRGYVIGSRVENAGFDPTMVIKL